MIKKLLSLGVSIFVLLFLYWTQDWALIWAHLKQTQLLKLGIVMAIWIPIIGIMALRFKLLIPSRVQVPYTEAIKLISIANTLNLVLPTKAGDFAKAFYIQSHYQIRRSLMVSVVVIEKIWDLTGLFFFGLGGLFIYHQLPNWYLFFTIGILVAVVINLWLVSSGKLARILFGSLIRIFPQRVHLRLRRLYRAFRMVQKLQTGQTQRFWELVFLTLLNSGLHFIQVWLLLWTLNESLPFLFIIALVPIAFLIALIPMTFMGVGIRDAALIMLFQSYLPVAALASWGVLCTFRIILPGLLGMPFLLSYRDAYKP